MKSNKSVRRYLLIIALVSMAMFVGVSGWTSPKDILIIGASALPPNIDEETGLNAFGNQLFVSLAETLISYGRKTSQNNKDVRLLDYDANYEMRLAERYEVSPDHKTITFHLRKGVKSPYGNEFTTKDVIYRWQRGFEMKALTEFYAGVLDISGMNAFKVIDDYTCSMTANNPSPLLEPISAVSTATGFLDSTEAKKHATADDKWAMKYISQNVPSFGPYYIIEWTPGQQAVFEANPNYYKGVPEIKKVLIKVIPESSSRLAMVKDGTIDVALELSPREINSLKGSRGVRVITESGVWLTHLILNDLVVEPFKNKLVRQAVNYAIDRKKIIQMAYYGMADPMLTYQRQFAGAIDPKEFPYDYNLEKAKKLMVQAGYPNGFSVDLYYQVGIVPHETACVIIQQDLAKIGIKVALRKTPIGTLNTLVHGGKCPFAIWRESPFVADPFYATNLLYLQGINTGGTGWCNFTGFNDAQVNKMIADGKTLANKQERYKHYLELQRLVLELAPIGFVVQEGYMVAINDRIEGWNIDVGEGCRFAELRFRK